MVYANWSEWEFLRQTSAPLVGIDLAMIDYRPSTANRTLALARHVLEYDALRISWK